MKKLAVFVEGQTEQIFVKRLIEEIAGAKKVHFHLLRGVGGKRQPRRFLQMSTRESLNGPHGGYYVMIFDSQNDGRVASDIRERYDGLVEKGYVGVVGLRDVHPQPRSAIAKIRTRMAYGIKTKPIKVEYVLSVMEVESWFMAEWSHFLRLDSRLSFDWISSVLGADPSVCDVEAIDRPALELDKIYSLAGIRYDKRRDVVQKTVDILDYEEIYLRLSQRLESLGVLIQAIDRFLM